MLARRTVWCIRRVCIRRVSSQPASLPPEFEALLDLDERPRVFSLDDVVGHVAPPVPIQWKSPSPRKGPQEVVREFRAALAVSGVVGALALLRENAHTPYPRLVAHAVVHSLLRMEEPLRAGAFLNAFATERTAVKLPRVHPTTLSKTIGALIALVPKTQGRQDRVRTAQRPALLRIQASMVSEPALRTALSLYLQARNLFVPRKRKDAAMILDSLFRQREWVPAALMFELQVKDHQLRRSIPFLLRAEDPAAPPLNPHDRHHLRRRLAVLQIEKARVSPAFFADLCFRIAGVLSSLTNRPESPYYAATEESPALSPGPRTPLTPQRAQHHARIAVQALTILGTLIKTRQIPFGNISAWIATVGSLAPGLDSVYVYATVDGFTRRVAARAHLREILEGYANALPRVPHIYSQFPFPTSGFLRRGLKHKIPLESVSTPSDGENNLDASASDGKQLIAAGASADDLPDELEGLNPEGIDEWELKKRISTVLRHRRRVELAAEAGSDAPSHFHIHAPPEDPVEAADDSLMPPPEMPTYEALLGVFLSGGLTDSGPGRLYASRPMTTASPEQVTRWNEGAAKTEAALDDAEETYPLSHGDELEASLQQHYHAPRSPNNPDPHVQYPAHPLDFDAYPAPPAQRPPRQLTRSYLGSNVLEQHRLKLATRVLEHMLHQRSPPLPPHQSSVMMRLLARRTDVLRPVLDVWDEIWEGAARARREGEVNMQEAQRLEAAQLVAEEVARNEDWAVEKTGFLPQRDVGEHDEFDASSRRLAAREWDKESDTYYNNTEE